MRIFQCIFSLTLLLLSACSVTGSLHRRGLSAQVIHTPKSLRVEHSMPQAPEYAEIQPDSRPVGYLLPTTTLENGEQITQIELAPIIVKARSRTRPERQGKVSIDFVVTLPRELQGTCRSIVITPLLHNRNEVTPLEELTIRGAFFNKVMTRDYWQYGRYLMNFRPDSARAAAAFRRFVRFPHPEGTRLDSVFQRTAEVSYFYQQDVPTVKAGKQLRITLEGRIEGLDGSSYQLPPSDTLVYHVSSLLTFADTTTHYLTRIIEKHAEVRDRNYLSFPANGTALLDTLGDNRVQLARIETLMEQVVTQKEFLIDSIILTASSSPEGDYARNAVVAQERAVALSRRLNERFKGIDTLITVRSIPEQWEELAQIIRADSSIRYREQILSLWTTIPDPDTREAELRRRFPVQYRYLRTSVYPQLRAVTFRYDLRRAGMTQDTVRTTTLDTLYTRGVHLLQEHRYDKALNILSPYRDRNTAIALLSLEYDHKALEILQTLPSNGVNEYLQAIALARLNREQEAHGHFLRACEFDENLEYRGDLDPEISKLKQQHEKSN